MPSWNCRLCLNFASHGPQRRMHRYVDSPCRKCSKELGCRRDHSTGGSCAPSFMLAACRRRTTHAAAASPLPGEAKLAETRGWTPAPGALPARHKEAILDGIVGPRWTNSLRTRGGEGDSD